MRPGDNEPSPTRLVCVGCGFEPAPNDPFPFRCFRSGEGDVDHVLAKRLAWRNVGSAGFWREVFARDEPNPFVRYRELLHSYHAALARGWEDEDFVALVRELDGRVQAVDGHGFVATPLARNRPLEDALGGDCEIWIKDETSNVAGSHKGRHLFGVLLWLEVARRTGKSPGDDRPRLAIASCGNAALAAAVLAKAGGYPLDVFVPPHAGATILDHLAALGAHLVTCPRASAVPGDPCVLRFREAVVAGKALPFTCQGNENGLAIEGGETLAYEIVSALSRESTAADRLLVQVGGGALASACAQGFARAKDIGALARVPRMHAVQTRGGYPLVRAWERFAAKVGSADDDAARDRVIAWAALHRSELMWPWEEEPKSVATGILDDETYDWLAVVRAIAETGGSALVVDEETLAAANETARRATGIAVDATGTAGLAGYVALRRETKMSTTTPPATSASRLTPGERTIVLFTGADRASASAAT